MKELDIVSLALRIVKENHPQMGCWWMCDFVGRRTSLVVVVRVHDSDYDRIVHAEQLRVMGWGMELIFVRMRSWITKRDAGVVQDGKSDKLADKRTRRLNAEHDLN